MKGKMKQNRKNRKDEVHGFVYLVEIEIEKRKYIVFSINNYILNVVRKARVSFYCDHNRDDLTKLQRFHNMVLTQGKLHGYTCNPIPYPLPSGHCLIVKTNTHFIHASLERGPEFLSIHLAQSHVSM